MTVPVAHQVSRGIECRDVREPVGVVACIVPFNFPAMVPMWTVPIALVAGNCVIVKPSEKVPLTLTRVSGITVHNSDESIYCCAQSRCIVH
jgi:acyl-CoA reductase-like NAD-dependent aldehyde dehydrogenase